MDIKPRNVFLTQRADVAEPGPVKVIDFGLAKFLDGQGSSRGSDGLLIGTPEYLAPEAWRGISSDIDARSDQWSLAVLTYRMLAGRMPFDGSYDTVMLAREILSATPHPLRQLIPDLPLHVEAAITQALAKDKALRFPSVLDFVRALHGLPLSSTVHLRRDTPAAQLPYNERPTAALLDYSDRPTAALLDYSDRPTTALALGPDPTAVVASSYSPQVELTALLPALPVSPSRPSILAASTQTPARSRGLESWRWRRLAAALSLLAVGATAGLMVSRAQPGAPALGQVGPRLDSAAAVPASTESQQPGWTRPGEPATPAASSPPGLAAEPLASCSCAPLVAIAPLAACPPVSGSASPTPSHRVVPARHRPAPKFPLSATAASRYPHRVVD